MKPEQELLNLSTLELIRIIQDLKDELIEAYEKRGDFYMAGEKEAIDKRIEELKR